MSLLENLKECRIDRKGKVSDVVKLRIAQAVSEEIDERGVIFRSELTDTVCILAGVGKNEQYPFVDRYVGKSCNKYIWERFNIKSISIREACMNVLKERSNLIKDNEVTISSRNENVITSAATCLLYKDEKRLKLYIEERLRFKSVNYTYEFG